MTPGMGAVATTFMAGVFAVRKGVAKPIGSLTQMGTIRLGKRTEDRVPMIKDFVPLTELNDLEFAGWDIFEDNAYEAALNAGVLDKELLGEVRSELEAIKPMPAVFDKNYVKKLDGPNVKKGANWMDLADQVRADIQRFKEEKKLDRVVMVWCGSTEVYMERKPCHENIAAFEEAMKNNDPAISPSMVYAYAAIKERVPYANGGAQPDL